MFKKYLQKTISILALLALFSSSIPLALANGNISLTRAEPDPKTKNNTWFNFELAPGNSIEDSVLVKNLSNKPVQIRISAIDSKTNKAGRFILSRKSDPQLSIGKWTQVPNNTLELAPNQSLPIPFTIKIPTDTPAGEYSGGIIVEEIQPNTTSSSLTTRIGNRIYLTVPGNINQTMNWNSFSLSSDNPKLLNPFTKSYFFNFDIENKGESLIRPKAQIEIFNIFGSKRETIERVVGEISPHSSSQPSFKWQTAPMFGIYTASATIQASENIKETLTKSITVVIIPWTAIVFITLLIAAIAFAIAHRKKKLNA